MSKFLTPPVWYDKNGNLNEMLTGNAGTSSDIAIGSGATAVDGGIAIGGSAGRGGVAIGGGASANEENSIAIGLNATVSELGCIAIGSAANVSTSDTIQLGNNDLRYTLNIGDGTGTIHTGTITLNGVRLSASGGVIQLGQNNTAYTLNVGNGTGTSKIGALSFDEATPTNITSNGLYWCTAEQTQTISGASQTWCCSAFLWIETKGSTRASATNGSATFTYSNQNNQGETVSWAIRVSGTGVSTSSLKCYRVFAL